MIVSKTRHIVGTCGLALVFAVWPSMANAQAFYLQDQSAKAAGRAFSGEAADPSVDALWWNPAAIAGAPESSAYLNAAVIVPRGEVSDDGTVIVRPGEPPAMVGGDPITRNPVSKGVVPSGGIALRLNDRWAVGLGVTSPFSFTTNYPSTSWTRYSATRTELRTIDLQPVIAFAPTGWLRLGVAANVEYTDATLSNALPNLSSLLADGSQRLKGHGWDVGWSAGAQLHNDRVTLGLSYKSSITHHLNGDIVTAGLLGPLSVKNGKVTTTAAFRTPWQAIAGIRFRMTDRLTLNAQAVRLGWNKFDSIRIGAPLNVSVPENYRNSWTFSGGVDYAVTPDWTMRGGVQFGKTPTQRGERDARVPDSNRVNFALGTSYRLNRRFTLDASANYVDFRDAAIDRTTAAYAGSAVQTPILTDGRIKNASALVFALGGRVSF